MSYHNNPAINDTMLSIINDGNGEMCGMNYKQRCAAAETGLMEFRNACQTYSKYRVEHFKIRQLKRAEIIEAATLIQEYYREHVKEM